MYTLKVKKRVLLFAPQKKYLVIDFTIIGIIKTDTSFYFQNLEYIFKNLPL